MFVDKVQVKIRAGNGGDGRVSFRHEKFIDKGGPDGGDGGDGGDVILAASRNQNTLAAFRYQKELKAESGQPGGKQRKHGKSGPDLTIAVPVGTTVADTTGKTLVDLINDGQQFVVAYGGKGGYGNAHFVSSRRQAPRVAEKGEKGDELEVTMELKMIADVGIIGLPNAGKSTLLASISNAQPQIADYPFTTLKPNLGMVPVDDQTTLLFADVPGLIEGASHGKGLGDEFLRHVERTSVLLHLIDAYEDITQAYRTIQSELKQYKIDLTKRPQVVALNKIDGMEPAIVKAKLAELKKISPRGSSLFTISATSGENVQPLLYKLKELVQTVPEAKRKPRTVGLPVLHLPRTDSSWKVEKVDDDYLVTGKKIERFAARTDFTNPQGVQRLRNIMQKMGIIHELSRQGIEPGDTIRIGSDQKTALVY